MQPRTFTIFASDKHDFYLNPNRIVTLIWVVNVVLVWKFASFSNVGNTIAMIWLIGTVLLTFYFFIARHYTHEHLPGRLGGKITFDGDGITVYGAHYDFGKIKSIDFELGDFYGKKNYVSLYLDFKPLLSQGVNNCVTFTDGAELDETIYFQLPDDMRYRELADFIHEAARLNKISRSRVTALLGNESLFND